MKPVLFAICAMVIYAISNVLYEARIAKFTNFSILFLWSALMLPMALVALGGMKITGQPIALPTKAEIPIILVTAILFFAADAFFTGAYGAGGTIMTVTSITIMFPAFATVIRYYSTGHTVNLYQVSGYLMAVGAVLLIQKGSQVTQLP